MTHPVLAKLRLPASLPFLFASAKVAVAAALRSGRRASSPSSSTSA